MKHLLLVILLVPNCLLGGCKDESKVDGWDVDDFKPTFATTFRTTPAGWTVDSVVPGSVAAGFLTVEDLDKAVDDGFALYSSLYPDHPHHNPEVSLYDDYVFWSTGGWAGGWAPDDEHIVVCIWSRGTSTVDPGARFIKRAPDGNYAWWRFTASPITPAICHELLHTAIGDPTHGSPLWSRMNATTSFQGEVSAWGCTATHP